MSSVTMMISRPGSSAIASFNSGVTLVAGVCCCEMAGASAPAPSITISASADWSVRQKGPVAPSAREDAVDCIARRSDDGFDLGYITYLLVDYEVKVEV